MANPLTRNDGKIKLILGPYDGSVVSAEGYPNLLRVFGPNGWHTYRDTDNKYEYEWYPNWRQGWTFLPST